MLQIVPVHENDYICKACQCSLGHTVLPGSFLRNALERSRIRTDLADHLLPRKLYESVVKCSLALSSFKFKFSLLSLNLGSLLVEW